jgi:hypothetical protein
MWHKNAANLLDLNNFSETHGLRTPNERYLKNWAYVADKICLAVPKNLGVSEFSAVQ